MNSVRLTVDLSPPTPPSWLEGVFAPLTTWVANAITTLSDSSCAVLKYAGKIAPIALRTLIKSVQSGVIETLPYILTYLSHEFIVLRYSDLPLAFVFQGTLCVLVSNYIDSVNFSAFQRRQEFAKKSAHDLNLLREGLNKKFPQSRIKNDDAVPPTISLAPNMANKMRVVAAIHFRALGTAYVLYGAYLGITAFIQRRSPARQP